MPKDFAKAPAIEPETHVFKTRDGAELIGQLYRPAYPPFAAVVLNGATGVGQHYYRHFARWLAEERGVACLTYDYRQTGRSAVGPMRHSTASMKDWGITDAEAARRALEKRVPNTAIWVMGHSLGGMLLPFQTGIEGIARVITVGAGDVHVSDHPWPYRLLPLAFWFGIGPAAARIAGYLPGRAIGFGADLPMAAYRQWKQWCTTRGSVRSDETMPDVQVKDWQLPLRMISFEDDLMAPTASTERMAERFAAGDVSVLRPRDFGLGRIGHLAAFHPKNRRVWPDLIA